MKLPHLAILACSVSLSACEPRVEEPLPPSHSDAPATISPSASASASAPSAERCIRPTPPQPTRKLTGPSPDPRCPSMDVLPSPPKLAKGAVVFANGQRVSLEIARRDEDRQRGLMFRRSMPADHGMLFVFGPPDRNHQFWMHNTCIPLDMLFVGSDNVIVGIEENVPTMDDSTFEVGCPSGYVIELNAGAARRYGIEAGQRVEFEIPKKGADGVPY